MNNDADNGNHHHLAMWPVIYFHSMFSIFRFFCYSNWIEWMHGWMRIIHFIFSAFRFFFHSTISIAHYHYYYYYCYAIERFASERKKKKVMKNILESNYQYVFLKHPFSLEKRKNITYDDDEMMRILYANHTHTHTRSIFFWMTIKIIITIVEDDDDVRFWAFILFIKKNEKLSLN